MIYTQMILNLREFLLGESDLGGNGGKETDKGSRGPNSSIDGLVLSLKTWKEGRLKIQS